MTPGLLLDGSSLLRMWDWAKGDDAILHVFNGVNEDGAPGWDDDQSPATRDLRLLASA